jgi:nucleoside-diphosphate-sugar epimerase
LRISRESVNVVGRDPRFPDHPLPLSTELVAMSLAPPQSVSELEAQLSDPSPEAIETMAGLSGDLLLLGVGGKMGPTMAKMARRADELAGRSRRIIGVSRFSNSAARRALEDAGIETVACDLQDDSAWAALPDAENVIYMTGFKFGASSAPDQTWAMNCYLPALACRRYPESRIVAFSSGNVYGMVPVDSGGSRETDALRPVGEYAMTALGRERMFQYFSRTRGTPTLLLRLNYATELRYGVLVDIAQHVFTGKPLDVRMGYVNVIWLGDANAMTLASLRYTSTPARIVNLAGQPVLRVREVAEKFATIFQRPAICQGEELDEALLNNGSVGAELLGTPRLDIDTMIQWTADWIARGGEDLGKPTHYEVVDGKF